jgi:hypothetical protein
MKKCNSQKRKKFFSFIVVLFLISTLTFVVLIMGKENMKKENITKNLIPEIIQIKEIVYTNNITSSKAIDIPETSWENFVDLFKNVEKIKNNQAKYAFLHTFKITQKNNNVINVNILTSLDLKSDLDKKTPVYIKQKGYYKAAYGKEFKKYIGSLKKLTEPELRH